MLRNKVLIEEKKALNSSEWFFVFVFAFLFLTNTHHYSSIEMRAEKRKLCPNKPASKQAGLREKKWMDLPKWRNISCVWIEVLSIVKMGIFPKLTYGFNSLAAKLPAGLCFFLPFFWPSLWHVEVLGPRIKPTPQQRPEPLQ